MNKSFLLAMLVCAPLLAGCSQNVADELPVSVPVPRFAEPVVPIDAPDGFGSEPSILATREGTLFIVSVLGSAEARGDGVWRSRDDGATWEYLGKVDYPFGGGDSDLDEDEAGRLYVTGQWRPVALPIYLTGGESVATSTDGGDTWINHPVAGYLPAADRQWVATHGDGTAYLVYNELASGLMVTKTTNGGLVWQPPVQVPGTASSGSFGFPNGIAGDPVVDADGVLYIPYGPGPGGSGPQRIYISRDGAASFEEVVVAVPAGDARFGVIFSSLAVDLEGGLYLVWVVAEGGRQRVVLSHSADGTNWSEAVDVSPVHSTAVFPWIVAGEPGRVAVTYNRAPGWFMSDDAPQGAQWFPAIAFSDDARAAEPLFTEVVLQQTPNHVGPLCTGGTGCDPQYRGLGDFFEAAMMPDGRVAVVWPDDAGDQRVNRVAVQAVGSLLSRPI